MYIKLKIEGELLELLKAESESECRTCTQQSLYIIKSHYKTKEVANNSDKELIETNKEFIETDLVKDITLENSIDTIPNEVFDF